MSEVAEPTMQTIAPQRECEKPLDRTINLANITWWHLAVLLAIIGGVILRVSRLDWMPLSADESRLSFLSLSLFDGRPLGLGSSLKDSDPTLLLGQAGSYFLFGVTDVTSRWIAVVAGISIVLLAAGLWKFTSRGAGLGMAVMAAFSPTLVYSSRVANSEILVACFSLLAVFAMLQLSRDSQPGRSKMVWSAVVGFSVASMLASGPTSISVLICLIIAGGAEIIAGDQKGAVKVGVISLILNNKNLAAGLFSLGLSLLWWFTLGFSSTAVLSEFPATFADWGRLMATQTSATPTQFFLLATLLYEILVLVAAIAGFALSKPTGPGKINQLFFLVWFAAALILFSFSSGRAPEQAIHVALPLVLWGGYGLSAIFAKLDLSEMNWKRTMALIGAIFLFFAGFIALIAEIVDDQPGQTTARSLFNVAVILFVAILLPAIAIVRLTYTDHERTHASGGRAIGFAVLVAALAFLSFYSFRSTVELSFYRADTSEELLAQQTSTQGVAAFARQITNLSRDISVSDGTVQDPTGGHATSIAMESNVAWPFQWYFRDFPSAEIVAVGSASTTGADLLISDSAETMDGAGYTTRQIDYRNRVPAEYVTPSVSNVFKTILLPTRWHDGARFLFLRQGLTLPPAQQVSAGYGSVLSNKLYPSSGPYDLSDRPGPGTGRGQFREPRGVAVSFVDGTIYVVDMANGRIERFSRNGDYAGSWGGVEGGVSFTVTDQGLGPTGIAIGIDGLVYVADTWAHRIVVLSPSGKVVREFGVFGDTEDADNANDRPGEFFGPRSVAVTADEIYVTDTGNERIQVFAPDGTFIRTWGGYGSGPSQFIEPVGVAIGPDGYVYVADSGNSRISVFAQDGTPLYQWPVAAWQGQSYFEPYLAFDQNGNLYATSSATGTVEVFDIEGNYLGSISQSQSDDIVSGIGIALDYDGNLRLSDRSIPAVLTLSPLPPEPPSAEASPENQQPATPVASPSPASPQASSSG